MGSRVSGLWYLFEGVRVSRTFELKDRAVMTKLRTTYEPSSSFQTEVPAASALPNPQIHVGYQEPHPFKECEVGFRV